MASLRMIDIAVNFTDNMFKGIYNGRQCHAADIPAVLTRAWSAGVDRIIVTGGSLEESKEALAIAETDGRLFCTVGVHPTRCKEFEESGDPERHFQALLSLAKDGIEKGKATTVGQAGKSCRVKALASFPGYNEGDTDITSAAALVRVGRVS